MQQQVRWQDYVTLCKPRVVALMVLTSIVAMFLASPTGLVSWQILIFGSLGITFAACSGGAINQLLDWRIDEIMKRTKHRPIPTGRVKRGQAIGLALVLAVASMVILFTLVNPMTAVLSLLTLIGYAGVYTLFLKRATPQNIVIGGLAGAMPPLLGWTAVTGHIDVMCLLLVLIIFTWTPPHFWALAIDRQEEYKKANIPMLPVTHGIPFTCLNVWLYTLLMVAVTYLPFVVNLTGLIYVIGVTPLNLVFIYYAYNVYRYKDGQFAIKTFRYSIFYLAMLFLLLLVDHNLLLLA